MRKRPCPRKLLESFLLQLGWTAERKKRRNTKASLTEKR